VRNKGLASTGPGVGIRASGCGRQAGEAEALGKHRESFGTRRVAEHLGMYNGGTVGVPYRYFDIGAQTSEC